MRGKSCLLVQEAQRSNIFKQLIKIENECLASYLLWEFLLSTSSQAYTFWVLTFYFMFSFRHLSFNGDDNLWLLSFFCSFMILWLLIWKLLFSKFMQFPTLLSCLSCLKLFVEIVFIVFCVVVLLSSRRFWVYCRFESSSFTIFNVVFLIWVFFF